MAIGSYWDDPRNPEYRDALERAKGLIESAFTGASAPKAYVAVNQEGGNYSFLPAETWLQSAAPIIGVWDGDWLYLSDSIIKDYRVRRFNDDDYRLALSR